MDLAAALPMLLPRAVAWANAQSQLVLSHGERLTEVAQRLARAVGVRAPNRIRVRAFEQLPVPENPFLREAALEAGLLGPNMIGLTLGYAVLLLRGHDADDRLLRHEFRHVYQYESAGSIAAFLPMYLAEIVQFGYAAAPSEMDARKYEDLDA